MDTVLLSQLTSKNETQVLGSKDIPKEFSQLCRRAAAEGIVMLKNDGLLPLSGSIISVFGRVQYNYFFVGEGSGGDVISPYKINLIEGIKNNSKLKYNEELAKIYAEWCQDHVPPIEEWGKWPTHHEEMSLTEDLVKGASKKSDVAVIVIGRSAGEDRDSLLEKGSFYLTDEELNMLKVVTDTFSKVVVLINSGNIIDFSWYQEFENKISALLYVWQGGMESGNAVCDILSGDINPSGKLTSTIAKRYEDYPSSNNFANKDFNNYVEDIYVGYRYFETLSKDSVLFPFGYGLSYTDFETSLKGEIKQDNDNISMDVIVKNIGNVSGSEIVQVYYAAPQGVLGKPAGALAAFTKTVELVSDAQEICHITFPIYTMASYDDQGKTGNKSAYVLEAGEYEIYIGNCVRYAKKVGSVEVKELTILSQLSEICAPNSAHKFQRLTVKHNPDGSFNKVMEDVPIRTISLKERILANLPKEIPPTGDKGYKLEDVASGKINIDDFIAQLDMNELEGLTRGDYIMDSLLGPKGNAGAFGGVTESLREKGVIPVITTDGPSGIRLKYYCALLPCGTALASTWNQKLLLNLAEHYGQELKEKGSHVLLAPGMNIMRNPLCGRNFEYFSEDPVLSGKIASSMVAGVQKSGKSACPKHFVCNNQEEHRIINDSRLSERALREIYLKGFEICIKEAHPKNIMTSYNKINGVWGHYHYELCTVALREEWGYKGNVITDWWMQPSVDPDFPAIHNDAYRIRAQVDVLMPGGTHTRTNDGDGSLLESYNKDGGITLAEIQRSAKNVLNFVLAVSYS
ncbi:MAG: glycoside hydrolase family 3 C-terminal domain-containing protein [Defluviitaleaceae bacterium]|nr:glycoside hydrolase family 3 C-terminal domain-containing protein [Defluviitaleaceae bacterium]